MKRRNLLYLVVFLSTSFSHSVWCILNNFYICVHSALTFVDEKRQISNLISAYVRRIDFKRDFEQQLEFYVEARGTFFNLDAVYATLVHVNIFFVFISNYAW